MPASCTVVSVQPGTGGLLNGNADVVSPTQCILLVVLSASIDDDPDKVSTHSLLTVASSSCLWQFA